MRIVRLHVGVLVMMLMLLGGMPRRSTAQSIPAMTSLSYLPVLITAPPALPTAWLPRLNSYRAAAGLPPVTEMPTATSGDDAHVNYMLVNPNLPLVHNEDMTKPGATPQGNVAAQQSNLFAGSPGYNQTQAIDAWMESVMHRFGMLRPEFNTTGFGMDCSNASCGAALNVLSGLGSPSSIKDVVYPGVNQQGVTTRVFSWQFYPFDPIIVPVSASLRDPHGASVPLLAISGVPTSYFNVYAVAPTTPLALGTTYTLKMQVKQNGQLEQKSWSFTTQAP